MLKLETNPKQFREPNRKKALLLLVYSTLDETRKSKRSYSKILELSEVVLDPVFQSLKRMGLTEVFSGNTKGGVEKKGTTTLKELAAALGVKYKNDSTLIKKCKEIVYASRKPCVCDICNESVPYLYIGSICNACYDLDAAKILDVPNKTRIAKCGHPSTKRYFKCELCLETLESDDSETYSVHLTRRR